MPCHLHHKLFFIFAHHLICISLAQIPCFPRPAIVPRGTHSLSHPEQAERMVQTKIGRWGPVCGLVAYSRPELALSSPTPLGLAGAISACNHLSTHAERFRDVACIGGN
jgi:hypothetical protein